MYKSREYCTAFGKSTSWPRREADSYVSVIRTSDCGSSAALTTTSLDVPPKNLTSILASIRGCSREIAKMKTKSDTTMKKKRQI